ncbi:aquaporin SIP1-1-like [Phoenix dactylifera]|uniref:Aquaporin SIP1-1-like n=1 Tax=Phoenix dactylifera TaxID=42345 RepID=A0A8B8ZW05_PHODC|nr:aquaporin SIP1-1-like [Phoenix dactylifera]
MGAIRAAVGDAVITFLWMFCVSTVGALTAVIASALQVQGVAYSLLITTTLIFLLLLVFNPICDAIGGASFNPTATAAFYAAGFGEDNLVSMALRFPAQAAGAVGGVLAIAELMPPHYKHTLSGPSLKVGLHTGAAAEGVLTFCITLAVLWIVIKGPSSAFVKTWLLAVTTVAFVLAGAGYTGPSMNPANAFGWAYISHRHNTWEQFYVYWICPFIGAILAAWVFRVLFMPKVKAKKA